MPETMTPVKPTWSRQYTERAPAPPADTNVGDLERWLSALGGSALAAYGLSRGTLLGMGLGLVGGALVYRGVSGHCPMYGALGVNTAQPRAAATSVPSGRGCKIEHSITINKSPEELYRFWRNLENLPRFMKHLKSVKNEGHKRSHWVAEGPMGVSVEWDAEIITERPNELIGWRSLPGSAVDNAGSVHFQRAPGGQGTEVRVTLKYDPPAGKVGAAVARLFGKSPEGEIQDDLQRLKQIIESGGAQT